MVARTRPDGDLVVIFKPDGGEPELRICNNGKEAWASAISLIARRPKLHAGDRLEVQTYVGRNRV